MLMWPFSRKAPTPLIVPLILPITETWRVGDLAECIADTWIVPGDERHPRRGSRYFVTAVVDGGDPGLEGIFLQLLGYPTENAWYAAAFRKIVLPGVAEDDAAGEHFPNKELVDG
jgi:hypothetical protein